MNSGSYRQSFRPLQTFAEIQQMFERACAWIESHGVKLERNRFSLYKESIKKIRTIGNSPNKKSLLPEYIRLSRHLFDINVINQIFRGLAGEKILVPKSSFAAIAEGPDLLSDETERNSRARNISFELEMAANLAKNFSPTFESRQSLADLCVQVNNCRVPIECKRPYCNLGKSAKDGFSQLRKRYSSESDRGILAISCSMITGLSKQILTAPDEKTLSSLCLLNAITAVEKFKEILPHPKSFQTIATVFHFRAFGILENGNHWTDQTCVFAPTENKDSPDRRIIEALRESIDSVYK